MGWVTLTLRKKELKYQHAQYQLRALEISREKRAMARGKQAENTAKSNDQYEEIAAIRSEYVANRNSLYDQIQARKDSAAEGETVDTSDLQQQINLAQEDYQEQSNNIKSFYDSELQMIEEEAADREAELDAEQVEVEALMEAVSQEMSAVSDAISSEIQNSTIKLS